jgi:hypothetical protein
VLLGSYGATRLGLPHPVPLYDLALSPGDPKASSLEADSVSHEHHTFIFPDTVRSTTSTAHCWLRLAGRQRRRHLRRLPLKAGGLGGEGGGGGAAADAAAAWGLRRRGGSRRRLDGRGVHLKARGGGEPGCCSAAEAARERPRRGGEDAARGVHAQRGQACPE